MGSGSNDAQKEAQREEARRQAAIAGSVGKIDAVFSDPKRQAQYDDFLAANRSLYRGELERVQGQNTRQMKFAMGRSGNAGGSLQVDAGRNLGEAFNKGLIESERMAQGDVASLKQSDQDSRLRLIGMAQGGLDATTGVRNAADALRSNLDAGSATRNTKAVGEAFSDFSGIYKRSQEEAARRRGEKFAYNTLYQPSVFSGQGGSSNGY